MDGLVWGACKFHKKMKTIFLSLTILNESIDINFLFSAKFVPVGYGIRKLQIMCVVEDEKVSVDLLVEKIQEFDAFVQSVDIAAFNKI